MPSTRVAGIFVGVANHAPETLAVLSLSPNSLIATLLAAWAKSSASGRAFLSVRPPFSALSVRLRFMTSEACVAGGAGTGSSTPTVDVRPKVVFVIGATGTGKTKVRAEARSSWLVAHGSTCDEKKYATVVCGHTGGSVVDIKSGTPQSPTPTPPPTPHTQHTHTHTPIS